MYMCVCVCGCRNMTSWSLGPVTDSNIATPKLFQLCYATLSAVAFGFDKYKSHIASQNSGTYYTQAPKLVRFLRANAKNAAMTFSGGAGGL